MDAVETIVSDDPEAVVVEAASWDGASLMCRCQGGQTMDAVANVSESAVPSLPEEVTRVERCVWPIEQLLVRTFSMPLSDPKLLDGAILAQEISDVSGEDGSAFWLAWHAGKTETGISGIVFGLSQSVRQMMSEEAVWNMCPQLLVDAWERLNALADLTETCAVIDEDAEGVFVGYKKHGIWCGMRRINRRGSESLSDKMIAEQIGYSWQAMGMESSDALLGRAGNALAGLLNGGDGHGQVEVVNELPSRHQANLAVESLSSLILNFRHGKWAIKSSWQGFRVWKRPLAMAAGLSLIWSVVTIAGIYSMDRQSDEYRAAIEGSFHKGLPNELVMLDPLAQLRKAAGSSGPSQSDSQFLEQLQHVSRLYKSISWEMNELDFRGGEMQMSGAAKDIDSLNRMRDQLQQLSGRNVMISDTDLSGGVVSFRMKW